MNDFENKNQNLSDVSSECDDRTEETIEQITPKYSASAVETGAAVTEESDITTGIEEADIKIKNRKKRGALHAGYDYLEVFCFALATMMVLFLFVFRLVTVDGDSMRTTLSDGDRLIISNLFYTPETGDIVVINPENHGDADEPIIKRVIATEGQKVFIDYENWEVFVDGIKLDEPYIVDMMEIEKQRFGNDKAMNGTNVPKYKEEFTVGEDKVFVMGDNRNNSKDSRSDDYGEMGVNRILGKVVFRIAPDFGFVD
ncbi:MAG: signal peptidase I [Clostridia bacterium]|nr:signal peptidase I [Clostridia bacterium]